MKINNKNVYYTRDDIGMALDKAGDKNLTEFVLSKYDYAIKNEAIESVLYHLGNVLEKGQILQMADKVLCLYERLSDCADIDDICDFISGYAETLSGTELLNWENELILDLQHFKFDNRNEK